MSTNQNSEHPYKGLQPYTVKDQVYFFGRESEQEIIESNLDAAPLTILHGASGVGKSSVLMAGVLPRLQQTPETVAVLFRDWQSAEFISALKEEVLKAIRAEVGRDINVSAALPFAEFLAQCNRELKGAILFEFILDQFEEYFLYHAPPQADGNQTKEHFDIEFARAVNRRDVRANFLLSMREDSLSKLDRFQGRIPNLLGNMLRIEHLDEDAARDAINSPLERYNERHPAQKNVVAEAALVAELLRQVQTGKVSLGQTAQGDKKSVEADPKKRIETAFLQMVLERLWKTERAADSNTLRLKTLDGLGGAERIVRTHLDEVMKQLGEIAAKRDVSIDPERARAVAAGVFRFLVTPSGMKVAHTASDLASKEFANLPPVEVEAVLNLLASPDARVLRSVNPPLGQFGGTRYEIFHDVLAPAILDWRARYVEEQAGLEAKAKAETQVKQRVGRLSWGLAATAIFLIVSTGLGAYAWQQRRVAIEANEKLATQYQVLEVAKRDLDKNYKDLTKTERKLGENYTELTEIKGSLDTKVEELAIANTTLTTAKNSLDAKVKELNRTQGALRTSYEELKTTQKGLETSNHELGKNTKVLQGTYTKLVGM